MPAIARFAADHGLVEYAFYLAFIVAPVLALLARRRVLTIKQWLLMARSCVFMVVAGVILIVFGIDPNPRAGMSVVTLAGVALIPWGFFGVGGYLLAAAIYPKTPPRTPCRQAHEHERPR